MTIGKRISAGRKALGLSQEALGERLGVSRQAVSKWETDAAAPDMKNLMALSRELGIPLTELTGTPNQPSHSPSPSGTSFSLFFARQRELSSSERS